MNDEEVAEDGARAADAESAAADTTPQAGSAEQAEIAALSAQVDSLKDELLRARAEMDNVRKRAERDVEAAHKYGQERFVHELIPVKDSIDLGLDAAEHATDIDSLRQGMELTAKAFADFFDKLAVSAIEPHGQPFDPEHHQAMTMEESAEHPPGTVIRVMQKGYKLNERLLRPALVVVAKTGGS